MAQTRRFSSKPPNNIELIILLFVSLFVFSGCSALISGYNSEFQCPNTDKGKCVSVKKAYKESIEGDSEQENPLVRKDGAQGSEECPECQQALQKEETPSEKTPAGQGRAGSNALSKYLRYQYQSALYKKLSAMIGKPSTPLVVPPEVVRVLILSYTGSNNELFSYRYVYFFATEPKWIISTAREVQ